MLLSSPISPVTLRIRIERCARLFAGMTLALLVGAVGAGGFGCETSCAEKGQEPILYSDGLVEYSGGSAVYATTAFDETWLHFPSERRFRLRHDLGATEYTPVAYVALSPDPDSEGDSGDFSQAAGNEVVFEDLTENELVVRNATCAEFYLLVRIESHALAP